MGGTPSKLGNNGGRFYSFLNRPVWIDCNFVVDSANANGLGISSLKGSGINTVFMYTSQSAGVGPNGITNPMAQNASKGYAWIQLANNYNRYCGGFQAVVSPVTGSAVVINSNTMTVGTPYQILTVGHGTLGAATIQPVADSSGSLASTWFSLYDNYGNTFIIWFSVSGVGAAPIGISGTLVQQSISTNASAATIGAALATTIANLPSGISGVSSFTTSGTTTVTVTSTQTNPYSPLPGAPADGTVATGFTFARTVTKTNNNNWQNVGLPKGIIPAVGASFVATATGDTSSGTSTGTVKAVGLSGISTIEVVGDPNQSFAPIPVGGSPNVGGWIMVQFLAATNSSTTTLIPTTPTDKSTVYMSFLAEAGSILISGE